jgi:hypothetical protein
MSNPVCPGTWCDRRCGGLVCPSNATDGIRSIDDHLNDSTSINQTICTRRFLSARGRFWTERRKAIACGKEDRFLPMKIILALLVLGAAGYALYFYFAFKWSFRRQRSENPEIGLRPPVKQTPQTAPSPPP